MPLLLLAAALAGPPLAHQPGPPVPLWTRINPGGGGWFARVTAGPGGRIVAASDLGGAYISRDDGQRWQALGPRQGLTTTHVAGAAFHPSDPGVWLLAVDGGIWRTGDDGRRFELVLDGGYVEAAAWSSDRVAWAAWHPLWDSPDGEVWRSDDGGLTWAPTAPLPGPRRLLTLRAHPTDPDVAWAIAGEGRFAGGPRDLLRTDDGGLSWVALPLPGEVVDLTPDLSALDAVWITVDDAAGDGVLLRSADLGDHVQRVADRGGVIWTDPRAPGAVRLLDPRWSFPWDPREGIWSSPTPQVPASWRKLSGAATWDPGWSTAYWAFTSEAFAVSTDPDDPDHLLWATSQFLYGTDDGGLHVGPRHTDEVAPGRWRSRGVDNVVAVELEAAAGELWAGFFDLGLWRSRDLGDTWTPCNLAATTGGWLGAGGNTWSVLTDPARPRTVWATQAEASDGPAALIRADDSGPSCAAWSAAGAGLPAAPLLGLSLDPTSPVGDRTLYLTAEGDVWRSDDDGATWRRVLAHGGFHVTAVGADGTTWAGGEAGLWVHPAGTPETWWAEVGLPAMRGPIFSLPGEWWKGVYDIAPDPHRPGAVWVSVFGPGGGLWRSPDRGQTWEPRRLDDPRVRSVRVDPVAPGVVYATASSAWASGGYDPASAGVWRSEDDGLTWAPWGAGLAWPLGVPMTVTPDGRWLVIGAQGPGLYRRRLR